MSSRPNSEPMPQAEDPRVSICILAGHGSALLSQCLESLTQQDRPPRFELLVGGRFGDETREVIIRHFPEARICPGNGGPPGSERNPLIEAATGELLLFLDDDVTVSDQLLRRVVELADRYPHTSVFGGPNETPAFSSLFQIVQGAVLSSVVGSGPVSRRYGSRHAGHADERWFTLCNIAVRRSAMLPFMADLVCAEENALLSQLRSRGEPMLYEPALRVFHVRRPTWLSFARQMVKYGRGRGQLLVRLPASARVAYLLPAALVLYALVVGAGVALGGHTSWPFLVPLAAYGLLVLAGAARVAWTLRRVEAAPIAVGLIITIHACYGGGVLRGLVSPRTRIKRRIAYRRAKLEEASESLP